jgi:2-phospho-L-lactate guanylyltransferase
MKTVILVPVKDPARAKARMTPVLTPEDRCRLAAAMFEDLIRILRPLSVPVVLVTDSENAARVGRKLGWRVLWETVQITESASVDEASRQLTQEGSGAVLRLPADIPLTRSQDIQQVLDVSPGMWSAVLVPSWDRMGTNAILRTPPDLFPSRFGQNSLVLHTQESLRVRARLELLENPRIALDLDDAGDIVRFLEQESDTATSRLLADLKLQERLAELGKAKHPHMGSARHP